VGYNPPIVDTNVPVWAVSLVGGGLAGGCVNVFFNRWFHWRGMRTKFYPVLNDIYAAYMIRMEKPEGRYWVTVVGQTPSREDEEFVDHRSTFIAELIQFNELKEARVLRKQILDNAMKGHHVPDLLTKVDLTPECEAITACFQKLHKKPNL
jgi:hypothetical protein